MILTTIGKVGATLCCNARCGAGSDKPPNKCMNLICLIIPFVFGLATIASYANVRRVGHPPYTHVSLPQRASVHRHCT